MVSTPHNLFPRLHAFRWWMTALLLWFLVSPAAAWTPPPGFMPDQSGGSAVGVRTGYLWGVHEIRWRDGDNGNIRPSRQDINLNSPLFGVWGQTAVGSDRDWELQAEGWINVPTGWPDDFVIDGTNRAWSSTPRIITAAASATYCISPWIGMPPRKGARPLPYAGILAGYRYENDAYSSTTPHDPSADFTENFQIHIPYLGISFADAQIGDSVFSATAAYSPITLAQYDGGQHLLGTHLRIDGSTVTGKWFQVQVNWSFSVGESASLGVVGRYEYLGMSGGVTVTQGANATAFSLDTRSNRFFSGITASYSF